jgi:hypothetical protein
VLRKLRAWAPILLLIPLAARAAPNEIKVFTDELAAYRGQTLETHINKARGGPLRLMPEWSYGIAPQWELSLQLPFAFERDRAANEGYRAELQYIAPHDEDRGFYWGINAELAREARLDEPRFWNVELIPIIGWRHDRWHLVANPGFERPVSGPDRASSATPAAKLAYRAFGRNDYGLELYRDADGARTVYFAWDGKLGKSDINVGVGRGVGANAERWVLKSIFEVAF